VARTPNEKFILLFEAAKRSLLACELIYSRLDLELEAIELDMNNGVEISERAAPPLLSAVAFIDFSHRFGSLVDSFPLINKRRPQLKQLMNALTTVETARNHLQHLRGDLSANDPIEYAILGSLSWTKGERCFVVSFSQSTNITQSSIVYDALNQRWISKCQFSVKGVSVRLDSVLAEMRTFYEWLMKGVEFSDPDFAQLKWGKTIAVAFKLTTKPIIDRTTPLISNPSINSTIDKEHSNNP
jgi:hypothetical protein